MELMEIESPLWVGVGEGSDLVPWTKPGGYFCSKVSHCHRALMEAQGAPGAWGSAWAERGFRNWELAANSKDCHLAEGAVMTGLAGGEVTPMTIADHHPQVAPWLHGVLTFLNPKLYACFVLFSERQYQQTSELVERAIPRAECPGNSEMVICLYRHFDRPGCLLMVTMP
jgi:hypothetical protein